MTEPAGDHWILATSNRGKLAEYRHLFRGAGIQLKPLDAGSSELPEETGLSFVENALIKARYASAACGKPAMADDSGLTVDALDGAPGVHSARYAGVGASDRDNLAKLLDELAEIPQENRSGAFHCVIVALKHPADPMPLVASGSWRGRITTKPKGSNGFGYDPVFLDEALGKTAAELSRDQKNALSHRARAAAELLRLLNP